MSVSFYMIPNMFVYFAELAVCRVFQDGAYTSMVLRIDVMQPQMYRTHYFIAENDFGSTVHTVLFITGYLARITTLQVGSDFLCMC